MSRKNLSDLRKGTQRLLGDMGTKGIPPSVIDEALNKAYKRLCKVFGSYRSSWTASAASAKRLYAPPRELVELERVDFDERELDYTVLSDITDFGDDVSIQTPAWTEDV